MYLPFFCQNHDNKNYKRRKYMDYLAYFKLELRCANLSYIWAKIISRSSSGPRWCSNSSRWWITVYGWWSTGFWIVKYRPWMVKYWQPHGSILVQKCWRKSLNLWQMKENIWTKHQFLRSFKFWLDALFKWAEKLTLLRLGVGVGGREVRPFWPTFVEIEHL